MRARPRRSSAERPTVRRPALAPVIACVLGLAVVAGCGGAPPRRDSARLQSATTLSSDAARAVSRGDARRALPLYEQVLALAESLDDQSLVGATLLNLSQVQLLTGDRAGADARLDRVLRTPERFGRTIVANAAARKAALAVARRDEPDAERWMREAQAQCETPCAIAPQLANLRAQLAYARGDDAEAIALATRAADDAARLGLPAEQASAWRWQARALMRTGRTSEAAQRLAMALEADRTLGVPARIAEDLVHAADNERARGRPDAEREFLERALDVYAASGDEQGKRVVQSRLQALARGR